MRYKPLQESRYPMSFPYPLMILVSLVSISSHASLDRAEPVDSSLLARLEQALAPASAYRVVPMDRALLAQVKTSPTIQSATVQPAAGTWDYLLKLRESGSDANPWVALDAQGAP